MAPLARGHEFPQDRVAEVAKSEKWLRLGHYEKGWFGPTSPFRGLLFVHPEGFKNPRLELNATLDAFLNPTPEQLKKYKMHPQCFFLARLHYLTQQFAFKPEQIQPCEERKAWKRKLNAKAVSIIFASADMNNAPSTFGHSFVKLINPDLKDSKDLINYGINYAADGNPNEAVFYAIKGLFGMYGGYFSMHPYHQKIREYTNMEGRDLWEFPTNLTPDEVDELVDHLLEMEDSRAPYYFLSDNCSYQILKALEVVRPDIRISNNLPVYVIPLDVIKRLYHTPGLLQPPLYQKSLKSDYLQGYRRLNSDQRKALTHAIDALDVGDDQLNAKERAEVLEAAMKFYALKAYQTHTDQDAPKYKLSVRRAKLGMVTNNHPDTIPAPPQHAHDSSALYLSGGHSETLGGFYGAKLRPAFHDLEQPDAGMVEFSHIEVLSTEMRYYPEERRYSLHKVTFINLLNSTPLTKLDRNLSWRARAEIMDPWVPHLEGGAGTSLDLGGGFRLVQLLNVKYLDHFLGAGPNLILAVRASRRLGISFDGGYYFSDAGKRLWELTSRLNWNVLRNWDIQFEHLSHREMQGKLLLNFLF